MILRPTNSVVRGSFRDPSGFVFRHADTLYRQINPVYKENYDLLVSSGLYANLTQARLLIPHDEVDLFPDLQKQAYRVIKPKQVDFISYPYEWCFSQLKCAALATLEIQKQAIQHGMILKDASAFNIQFDRGRPILIDTLSFDRYLEGQPWVAYKQFCQHFLAPLALMTYRDIRFGQMFRVHLDGIPLDFTSALLPRRTWLSFSLLTNIHLHARSQMKYASKAESRPSRPMPRRGLMGLLDVLESAVSKLTWRPVDSVWADYYDNTNYEQEAIRDKERLVTDYLDLARPKSVWDLGANTGRFSRIAARRGIDTIAYDFDYAAVEKNYLQCLQSNEEHILPLVLDLTNPSPGIGWEHQERMSLVQRGPTDTILALALMHHLAIGNNLPLHRIAGFLKSICQSLIIEFVPKDDSQVQRLLASREDVFPEYNQAAFEHDFGQYFKIEEKNVIRGTGRTLYLMRGRL